MQNIQPMKQHETIKRYYLIVSLVKQNQYPTFEKILEMLRFEKFNIESRTLQRDIKAIKNEFGIELVYDRRKNGYYIDLEESENIEYILRFLGLSISTETLISSLKEGKEALQYISLDSSDNLSGVQWLRDLFMAIKTKRRISFDHTSFQTGKTQNYTIEPYLLKEYKGRWFIYGYVPRFNDFRIYGVERINKLILTDEYFSPIKNLDPAERFEDVIGVNLNPIENKTIQTITLTCDTEQGKYFKSLPWLPCYETLIDTEDEFRFSLRILPNYEFLQLLLSYCNRITVIEPQWLRDYLKKILAESAAKY